MSRLEVVDLRAGYGEVNVLGGVSLTLDRRASVALFGANGSGKSTLLRAISGMIPYRGSVRLDRKPVHGASTEALAALGLAHVPQGRGTFVSFSVEENLLLGGATIRRGDRRKSLERVYDLLPELKTRRRQMAGSLSGGEQQMLAVGRALMMRPRVLLLDELSFGLAPTVVARLFAALNRMRHETDLALLLVEQSPYICADIADVAILLEAGTTTLRTGISDPELPERLRRTHLAVA